MSTRPYMRHGGLRIRQCYNRTLLRYGAWCKRHEPVGAPYSEWLAWKAWVQQRELQMVTFRDHLIDNAIEHERRKANERKRRNTRGS